MKEINSEQTLEPAGFWRRVAGTSIDSGLTALLIVPILLQIILSDSWNVTAWLEFVSDDTHLLNIKNLICLLINWVAFAIYIATFESSPLQATAGCYLMGMKILNKNGTPIGFIKSFFRTLTFCLCFSTATLTLIITILNIGYFIYDDQKRFLHDIIFRTRMVRR